MVSKFSCKILDYILDEMSRSCFYPDVWSSSPLNRSLHSSHKVNIHATVFSLDKHFTPVSLFEKGFSKSTKWLCKLITNYLTCKMGYWREKAHVYSNDYFARAKILTTFLIEAWCLTRRWTCKQTSICWKIGEVIIDSSSL